MIKYNFFLIEITDTFGGEANYCWVKRYVIRGKTELGAIQRLSRQTGSNWKHYGFNRYNSPTGCTCLFIAEVDDCTVISEHRYAIDDRV